MRWVDVILFTKIESGHSGGISVLVNVVNSISQCDFYETSGVKFV